MLRAWTAALAAGSLLGKAAVAFVGVLVIAGAIGPVPRPDRRPRSEGLDPLVTADKVVLTVPEGELSRTLTLVDASGRELAKLTYWTNGDTTILAPRRAGAGVGCFLNARGSAVVLVAGTARQIRIEAEADGTTKTAIRAVSPPADRRPPRDPEPADP